MPPRCTNIQGTILPFLYPFLAGSARRPVAVLHGTAIVSSISRRQYSIAEPWDSENKGHLNNPPSSDYSRTIFADRATVTVHAGSGGHGCISFLREKYVSAGPPNGGDGGNGGNVYIQAVHGETSLHKLARRNVQKAGRGKNGQGKNRSGERGEDIVLQVPVGTVVRELERIDPIADEELRIKEDDAASEASGEESDVDKGRWNRDRWVLYPGMTTQDIAATEFPRLTRARRSHLSLAQTQAPISLDLSMPMERPILLAAGSVGGLGNPHFVTRTVPRPKIATKGAQALQIELSLELKLLADVGLVGLPNAGKSTLLRSVSKSRARVGDWAFTTLQPNIGTVVVDDHRGRPDSPSLDPQTGLQRTKFTIADIPGLIQDAHLDRGLGISFLRHVERARLLAFVVDLGAGDAVKALKGLWREVRLYEVMRRKEGENANGENLIHWSPLAVVHDAHDDGLGSTIEPHREPKRSSIAAKPWFVVATKADLPGTQENFEALREYLIRLNDGEEPHPSDIDDIHGNIIKWKGRVEAFPISAINRQGVDRITDWTLRMLEGS